MHQLPVIDFIFIALWCCENNHDAARKVVDGEDGIEAATECELLSATLRIWYAHYNKMQI